MCRCLFELCEIWMKHIKNNIISEENSGKMIKWAPRQSKRERDTIEKISPVICGFVTSSWREKGRVKFECFLRIYDGHSYPFTNLYICISSNKQMNEKKRTTNKQNIRLKIWQRNWNGNEQKVLWNWTDKRRAGAESRNRDYNNNKQEPKEWTIAAIVIALFAEIQLHPCR